MRNENYKPSPKNVTDKTWEEIPYERPAKPSYPQPKIINRYGDYGFVSGTRMISIPEEERHFRKHIHGHIIEEHIKTRNMLGEYINEETNRGINEVNDYVEQRENSTIDFIEDKKEEIVAHVTKEVDDVQTVVNDNNKKLGDIGSVVSSIYQMLNTVSSNVSQILGIVK